MLAQREVETRRLLGVAEGPGVLPANLLLLLLSEVILDVEHLADLSDGLALHHVGDLAAGDVEEPVHDEGVGGLGEVEEGVLAEAVDELAVPILQLLGWRGEEAAAAGRGAGDGVGVLVAVVRHLLEGLGADLLELNAAVAAAVGDHLGEDLRQPCRRLLRNLKRIPIRALQGDHICNTLPHGQSA